MLSEGARGELDISDYSISQTTLDDVFMSFAEKQEREEQAFKEAPRERAGGASVWYRGAPLAASSANVGCPWDDGVFGSAGPACLSGPSRVVYGAQCMRVVVLAPTHAVASRLLQCKPGLFMEFHVHQSAFSEVKQSA